MHSVRHTVLAAVFVAAALPACADQRGLVPVVPDPVQEGPPQDLLLGTCYDMETPPWGEQYPFSYPVTIDAEGPKSLIMSAYGEIEGTSAVARGQNYAYCAFSSRNALSAEHLLDGRGKEGPLLDVTCKTAKTGETSSFKSVQTFRFYSDFNGASALLSDEPGKGALIILPQADTVCTVTSAPAPSSTGT